MECGERHTFDCGCSFLIVGPPPTEGALPLLDFSADDINEDCPTTWEMLGRGLTKGVFQLENPYVGRKWTKRLKPTSLEHLVALGSILRPGCLAALDENKVSMTEHYCRRKNGEEPVESIHPAVDSHLSDTYAIVCFQEQILSISRDVAGFNLVEQDQLRAAVGKKSEEKLAKAGQLFKEKATALGVISELQIQQLWNIFKSSGRYCFNRSHAACYAVLGYQTAYIKAHFPTQFFCAWLANAKYKRSKDPKEEMAELVEEAKHFGVEVLPPDLRFPEMNFSTDGVRVRFGVAGVKGVGEAMTAKLRQVLETLPKPLSEMSRWEFVLHSDAFPMAALLRLIRVGALDWLKVSRRELVEECKVWSQLTEKERGWIREKSKENSFDGLIPALKALALPKRTPPDRIKARVPRKGYEEEVARLEAEEVRDEERIFSLTKNKYQEVPGTGYSGPEGGCANEARMSAVASHAMLLERPPSPLVDSPVQTALDEEDLLGVALSVNRTMAFDISAATCTCLEYASGRSHDILLGVELREVNERVTKSGKNPGQKMAILKVSDGTCLLEDVVAFPEAYAEFGRLLIPGAVVLLQGERDRRPNSNSLFVSRVWPAKGSIS